VIWNFLQIYVTMLEPGRCVGAGPATILVEIFLKKDEDEASEATASGCVQQRFCWDYRVLDESGVAPVRHGPCHCG
jgi:hypothetical protein